jgi:hypothetical protein
MKLDDRADKLLLIGSTRLLDRALACMGMYDMVWVVNFEGFKLSAIHTHGI